MTKSSTLISNTIEKDVVTGTVSCFVNLWFLYSRHVHTTYYTVVITLTH
jgi:hypothetical protein